MYVMYQKYQQDWVTTGNEPWSDPLPLPSLVPETDEPETLMDEESEGEEVTLETH